MIIAWKMIMQSKMDRYVGSVRESSVSEILSQVSK
jgi:hypothetical protein